VDNEETQTNEKRSGKNHQRPNLNPNRISQSDYSKPYAKAKQKVATPASATKRYKLIGELRTPVHEGWEPREFHMKNTVINKKFQQLVGVMRNTDSEVTIQPYTMEKTLGKLSAPAKPIDEHTKQFPRNSWTVGDFIEGTFHASGQSSIVQCCISMMLKPEDFVTEFNNQGDELDKEDKWMMFLCQPRGQCASYGAPDMLVVNAVF